MIDILVCRACGTEVHHEFRTHCGRCGGPLVPSAVAANGQRRPRGTLAVVVGCIALGGIAAIVGGGSSPPESEPVSAVNGAPQVAQNVSRAARVDRAGAADPVRPEPIAASLENRRSGVAAYLRGDASAALDEFAKAVEANPDDAEARNNLGQVLVRTSRAGEAIVHFDHAVAIAGDRWAYHFNRARAYAEMKEWPRAVAGYRDAASLFPEDYVTRYNLARALQASGDLTGAISAFQQAIKLAPGQADFHLSYALALEAAGRPSDAASAYRSFLGLEATSLDADKIKARISQLEGTPSAVPGGPRTVTP